MDLIDYYAQSDPLRLRRELDVLELLLKNKETLVTPEGILLDGKIIYQEDIDEGRVKLPDF